jgi:hypothetical protein
MELFWVLDELDWLPALASSFSKKEFLWMVRNPWFFQETFQYTGVSPELLTVFWKFEMNLVMQLPFDRRHEYAESAEMLRGAETSEFFAPLSQE